jgi:hypothetical protein
MDFSGLVEQIGTALGAIIGITSGGIAVFGVIHFIEANSNNDPQSKTQGIKQIATGAALFIVGAGLVTAFTGLINSLL